MTKTTTIDDNEKMKKIEQKLKKLSGVSINAKCYGENELDVSDFHEWIKVSKELKDPDKIRNALYYGFQPLFDNLIEDRSRGDQREAGLYALDHIIDTGIKFLTSYYTGETDVKIVTEGLTQVDNFINRLDGTAYRTKFRNVDYNGIYPRDIVSFMKQFLEYCLDEKTSVPDHIIGCACGSSEIVMPLSGVIEADLSFIRRSYRRGDDEPRIIKEQENDIKNRTTGRNVLCVEDYVCTGRSLFNVMKLTQSYKPKELHGASINSGGSNYIRVDVHNHKFQMYSMR